MQGSLKFHFDCSSGVSTVPHMVGSENYNIGAYASVLVSKSAMVVTHLNDAGTPLFTAPSVSPRKL